MRDNETPGLPLHFGGREQPSNILPRDGEAIDYGIVFEPGVLGPYLSALSEEVPWRHDEVVMFGKRIVTARRVAWYGDRAYDYSYSGRTRTALIWTPLLHEIKTIVEGHAGVEYNSCLLNFYADGRQGMGWHSDDEKELGVRPNIASVSFGATRRFDFRHKETSEKISIPLESGSLLVMKGVTQGFWQHQIPKSVKVKEARINLTFRKIVEAGFG